MPLNFETRGFHLIVPHPTSNLIEGKVITHGTPRVWVGRHYKGEWATVQAASVALEGFLTPDPQDPESPVGTRVIGPGGGEVVDALGNHWTIEAGTNLVLQNGQNFNGGWASQLLYYDSPIAEETIVWHKGYGTGHWYYWDAVANPPWVDNGPGDPTLPPPSDPWDVADAPGEVLVDLNGDEWSLGTQFGAGYDILKNGVVYGGWALKLKIDEDLITMWHESPSGGWIKEDEDHLPNFWEEPGPDPETGDPIVSGNGVTTGSITQGTNTLTVVDSTSWTDTLIALDLAFVIVQTGKEAGGGARGTVGVGGQWPSSCVATVGALPSAGANSGRHMGVLADGWVYRSNGSVWQRRDEVSTANGKNTMIQPHALIARVRTVNRTTPGAHVFTLENLDGSDCNAVATATGATVYLDVLPIIMDAWNDLANGTDPGSPSTGETGPHNWGSVTLSTLNLQTLLPGYTSGALGGPLVLANGIAKHVTCNTPGSFRLFSPKGAPSATVQMGDCDACLWSNITIEGNYGIARGFAELWTSTVDHPALYGASYQDDYLATQFVGATPGLVMVTCTGCEARDYTARNIWTKPWGTLASGSCHGRDVTNIADDPKIDYLWEFQCEQGSDNWGSRCNTVSQHVHGGYEHFAEMGGGWFQCTSQNGTCSMNSTGGGWEVRACIFRFTPNSLVQTLQHPGSVFINEDTPVINVQANAPGGNHTSGGVAPGSWKGIIIGNQVTIEGYQSAANDTLIGIVIGSNNPDVRVEGNFHQCPNYLAPSTVGGSVLLKSEGTRTHVIGNTHTGASRQSGNNWGYFCINAPNRINGGGNIGNTPIELQFL